MQEEYMKITKMNESTEQYQKLEDRTDIDFMF